MTTAAEVLTDAAERAGLADFAANAAAYLVAANRRLSRALRAPEMHTQVTVPLIAGEGDMPADCISVIAVASGMRELQPGHYRIAGGVIHAPYDEVSLTYYAALPPLAASDDTNWLSLSNPQLYAATVAHEALIRANDAEKAQAMGGYVADLIRDENRAAVRRGTRAMALRRI